ncbi:MAG: hypothetical protein ACYTBJ_23585 [Planctomycetota bacterium]|jgi:hypothetical protein
MNEKVVLMIMTGCFVFGANVVAKMPPPIAESAAEPIKYVGEQQTDKRYHHGGLRHVVGVHRYQAFRANREHAPEIGSRSGWTYSHQPYLCYWNNQFYLQYLSNQYTEHLTPGRTLLMTSKDGRHWSNPEIIFPEYALPEINYVHPESGKRYRVAKGAKAVMHQRMGFYITSDGRLLTLAFYSYCPITRIGPNNGQGLGRVVREVHKDGTYGPIHFIRYNRHAGWNESNTDYPFYKDSPDKGFVKACDELLNNTLVTLQWWEEDRAQDGFYTIKPGDSEPKAFNFFRRPDGAVVGIWKHQLTALSGDNGQSWTKISRSKTLKTCGAKVWGQQTEDGRYALVYNHSATRRNRYPMVVMTSEDGHEFDNMLCLHGEVPPMRYYGWAKNKGPQYIRGIIEGNGNPPGAHMWNTYSVNKEDIWVTRTPTPIRGTVDEHVSQDFEKVTDASQLALWNLYVPKLAPTSVVDDPTRDGNRCLELRDEGPYDYACVERAFPPAGKATIEFSVHVRDTGKDILEFELHGAKGERGLRLRFDADRGGITFDLGGVEPESVPFRANRWYDVKIRFDCDKGKYDVWLDGNKVRKGVELDVNAPTFERMVFRTGSWRADVRQYFLGGEPSAPGVDTEDLPGAGEKAPASIFLIDNVKTREGQ